MTVGVPGEGYPHAWSVYRWIKGERAAVDTIGDLTEFATALAGFLVALRCVDAAEGPGRDGRLSAVIDFGTSGVGDPACDVFLAWTMFSGPSRDAFRSALGVDRGTWSRGRGWALWKALIMLVDELDRDPIAAMASRRVIEQVVADHAQLI